MHHTTKRPEKVDSLRSETFGESRPESPAGLKMAREQKKETGVGLSSGGGRAGWGLPQAGRGLCGFTLPVVPKEGAPRLSYQLTQMWGRRKKERWGLKLSGVKYQNMEL